MLQEPGNHGKINCFKKSGKTRESQGKHLKLITSQG